jgi:hypothetical protein
VRVVVVMLALLEPMVKIRHLHYPQMHLQHLLVLEVVVVLHQEVLEELVVLVGVLVDIMVAEVAALELQVKDIEVEINHQIQQVRLELVVEVLVVLVKMLHLQMQQEMVELD